MEKVTLTLALDLKARGSVNTREEEEKKLLC